MSGVSTSKPKAGLSGWGIVAIVGVVLFAIAQCSGSPKSDQQVAAASFTSKTSDAIASVAPPVVEPLEMASVKSAAKDFKVVYTAEQIAGAMIFSQNCFEGLAHEFSWSRLDECGAFDALALRQLDAEIGNASSEYAYFDQEMSAGRYLAAVSSAGESAEGADQRLEDLLAKAAIAVPAPKLETLPEYDPDAEPSSDHDGALEVNA